VTDPLDGLLGDLGKIVGREHVSAEPEDRILASYDATRLQFMPYAVLRPRTAEEIAGVMALANRRKVPVYVRGAASGLTGGALPVRGGLVMDLSRMNRILSIDEQNLLACAEPGVVVGDLQRAVERRGLFYPPDPASADFSTLGGNVAECAGGLRALKYGVTRDYVVALEVVLPRGEIIHVGARTLKSVTGYDLTRLFVGSEGTLGIFTRIWVRLIPLPRARRTLLALFQTAEAAAEAAGRILQARVLPCAIELMDGPTVECIRRHRKVQDISEVGQGALLVEVDGHESACAADIEEVEQVCGESGALEVRRADSPSERERLWEFRRAASPALYSVAPNKLNEDLCVLPGNVPEMLRRAREVAGRRNLFIACFGHVGEGNLHVNVMFPHGEEHRRRAQAAVEELVRAALDLGGTLSGEHGIGITKAEFLPLEVPPAELELMRSIKRLFDPNDILNPGKIFPPSAPP